MIPHGNYGRGYEVIFFAGYQRTSNCATRALSCKARMRECRISETRASASGEKQTTIARCIDRSLIPCSNFEI